MVAVSSLVLVGFVALIVLTEAFFTGLAALNVRYGERAVAAEREWVRSALDVDDPEELLRYVRIGTGFGQLRAWVGILGLLLVVPTGLFGEAVTQFHAVGLGPIVEGTAFFIALTVLLQVLSVPFDLVDTFVIEDAFDFNQQSLDLWLRDFLVGLALSIAFVTPLAAVVVWLLESFPGLWWAGAWVVLIGFSLLMQVLYPRVIAPLFNEFRAIDEGNLREAVDEIFDRAGFRCEQIYEMDASRRSSHSNAYFVGFGRTKRVVLFDTLIEQMDLRALQSVLAHELAHWKRGHIWLQLASTAIRTAILLAVLGWLVGAAWLRTAFGLPVGTPYASLVLGVLFLEPLIRFSAPIENRLSLRHEREADAFAVDVMEDGEPLVDALTSLAGENLANPFPHPWYEAFHYTHPPIPDRIRAIREDADTPAPDAG